MGDSTSVWVVDGDTAERVEGRGGDEAADGLGGASHAVAPGVGGEGAGDAIAHLHELEDVALFVVAREFIDARHVGHGGMPTRAAIPELHEKAHG